MYPRNFMISPFGARLLMIAGEFDLSGRSMIGFAGMNDCHKFVLQHWVGPSGIGNSGDLLCCASQIGRDLNGTS